LPKNTTQCPRPGLEPGPLYAQTSTLTTADHRRDNQRSLLFFSDIVAFKEEFYELIDDVDAPPKQEHMETEATDSEKSEEKQKQAGNN